MQLLPNRCYVLGCLSALNLIWNDVTKEKKKAKNNRK